MIKILYAEDDSDDADLFRKALNEIEVSTELTRVKDGEELMELMKHTLAHDILFLDINIPLKNGYQCVTEIRADERFKYLPIIIFTTTTAQGIVKWLFDLEADLLIKKPNDFQLWKRSIEKALSIDYKVHRTNLSVDNFVLNVY